MRGTTTLILHSLDPESLDKVDDLDSLDPESEDDDPYQNIYATPSEMSTQNRIPKPVNSESEYKAKISSPNSLKNVGHAAETNPFPIFDLMQSDLPNSPPLTKSYYYKETENHGSQRHLNDIMSRLFYNSDEYPSSQSDSMKEKTFTSSGSGLPLSRLKSCRNEILSPGEIPQFDETSSSRGLTRFLIGIGLIDKLRSNKADKNKFNVHTLPPQMKEELKHIYVY